MVTDWSSFFLIVVTIGLVLMSLYALRLGLRLRSAERALHEMAAAQAGQQPARAGRGFAMVMLVVLLVLWVVVMRAGL